MSFQHHGFSSVVDLASDLKADPSLQLLRAL